MARLLFGLNVPTSAAVGADPVSYARTAEEVGFDFVSASDHPCGTNPSYETWTMLSWIAAATSRIKVATRVLGVPYRSPAMVAKMAETLDRLSGGRLILGMGGGYSDEEFHAFGLRVPSAKEKIEGLEEAVRIVRGLWSEPTFTYEGHTIEQSPPTLSPNRSTTSLSGSGRSASVRWQSQDESRTAGSPPSRSRHRTKSPRCVTE